MSIFGIKVILSGVNPNVYEDLRKATIFKLVGSEFIFGTFEAALEEAKKHTTF